MERQAGRYFLGLVATGVTILLATTAIIALMLSLFQRLNIYDFGVVALFTGSVDTVLSFLLLFSSSSWRVRLERYLPLEARGQGIRDYSKDFLWTTAMSGMVLAICGYVFITISQQFGIRAPDPDTSPSISLLREEIDLHEDKARQWQENAYLHEAEIWIGDNPRWVIASTYFSTSKSKQFLHIKTNPDGSITSELFETEYIIRQTEPIHDEDWVIDSRDALDIFMQNHDIRFCVMSNLDIENRFYSNVRLVLRRSPFLQNEPVVWELRLPPDCTIENSYYLDAFTGEIILQGK